MREELFPQPRKGGVPMPEFDGKTVVVTGGAQGIGQAISRHFLVRGAQVSPWDRDREALEELAKEWKTDTTRCLPLECDVSNPDQVQHSASQLVRTWSQVDILVNNAGIFSMTPLESLALEEWNRILATNLTSIFLTVRHLLSVMPQGSCIVNIASTRALQSEAHTEAYSASKGGVLALTHALAVSLSPKGIRVVALTPGWIETSPWKKSSVRSFPHLREIDHFQHPTRRVGTPEDIAEACAFFASSRAGFITGTHLVIDGGMTVKMIYAE